MDIQKVMSEIATIEREKAQLELLTSQLQDQKADLEKRMKEAGVTPETIDEKIAELEGKIADQLKIVRNGQQAAPVDTFETLNI